MSKDLVEEVVWFFVKKFARKLKTYLRNFFKKSKDQRARGDLLSIDNVNESNQKLVSQVDNPETVVRETKTDEETKSITESEALAATPIQTDGSNESIQEEDFKFSSSYNKIFFHTSLFFIWFILAVINVPAVLTWAHNFRYTMIVVLDIYL